MRPINYFPVFAALMVIISLGLSVIWSMAPNLATSQTIALGIGIIALLVVSRLDSQWLFQLRWPLYWTSLILLIATEVLGITTRGSTRWINLGLFNFQTSEFIKPALIVSFAGFFVDTRIKGPKFLFRQIILLSLPLGLIFWQPDLGSASTLAIIWLGMLLVSSVPKKYLIVLIMLSILVLPFGVRTLKPYQRDRLESFLNPFADPSGSGYNVIQSMIAVGNGRIWGKGVRQGTQSHLRFLPERHTDFAFASYAEEFGFVGVTILLLSFFVFLNWIVEISSRSSPFGRLVTQGFFWWVFGQMAINIGMNMGIMPVTGITLPLVSYGGSSLLSLFIGLGTVIVFARESEKQIDL